MSVTAVKSLGCHNVATNRVVQGPHTTNSYSLQRTGSWHFRHNRGNGKMQNCDNGVIGNRKAQNITLSAQRARKSAAAILLLPQRYKSRIPCSFARTIVLGPDKGTAQIPCCTHARYMSGQSGRYSYNDLHTMPKDTVETQTNNTFCQAQCNGAIAALAHLNV